MQTIRLVETMRLSQVGITWFGAALLGGAVFFSACARPGSPSGGPRDFIPPMIASTWPDTFEVIEATRDPVKIVFSERISERPTEGTMDNAVLVSPITGEHRAKHSRSGLEIDVIGGFQPNLVYRVRILPTVKDLFGNTLEGPFELVFSTGADFEHNVIAGMVEDRVTGEVLEGARVEARVRAGEDNPVHVAITDSVGVFALRYLPSGSYEVSVYQDVNRNAEVDFAELQGQAESVLEPQLPLLADTAILRQVTLLRPDTSPARLIRVEALDSVMVRLAFNDYMDAEGSLDPIQIRIGPEEGEALEIDRLLWPRQVDSLRAVEDSIAAEEERLALVDSLGVVADSLDQVYAAFDAAGDSLGIDTLGAVIGRIRTRMEPPEPLEEREDPTGGREEAPPPILPQQEFFVRLAEPLPPDLLVQAVVSGVVNLNGLGEGGGEASFMWEPPEPAEEPGTAGLVPDTAAVPPDTAVAPPDTAVAPPDTAVAPPDTATGRSDSTSVPPGPVAVPPPDNGFVASRRAEVARRGELRRTRPRWWPSQRRP